MSYGAVLEFNFQRFCFVNVAIERDWTRVQFEVVDDCASDVESIVDILEVSVRVISPRIWPRKKQLSQTLFVIALHVSRLLLPLCSNIRVAECVV